MKLRLFKKRAKKLMSLWIDRAFAGYGPERDLKEATLYKILVIFIVNKLKHVEKSFMGGGE